MLAALAISTGLSGCVTSHVWHEAAHHGHCDEEILPALVVATPILLAIDLVLLPWQFEHCH